ncbi:MAG: hypothetical protein ACLGG7_13510, partial [Bacteriovoracia bacterium]
ATGPSATNNHVYLLARNATTLDKELFFARIDVANSYQLAANMPQIPLDGVHEQAQELKDYKIRALSGNKRAALGTYTNGGDLLISILKPVTTSSDLAMIRPLSGAGSSYPTVEELSTVPTTGQVTLALSMPFSFTVGDAGAAASENVRESIVMLYPSNASVSNGGVRASFLNLQEDAIQATSNSASWQAPYIK